MELEAQDIETLHPVNDAGQSHCKFIANVAIARVSWGFHRLERQLCPRDDGKAYMGQLVLADNKILDAPILPT